MTVRSPGQVTTQDDMKTTLLACFVLLPFCIGAQPVSVPVAWRPAPSFNEADSNWVILQAADIYEVGTSHMADHAIRDLPECGFQELSEADAKRLGGNHYSSAAGKHPFLVRAVYVHNGIGAFRVERKANSLVVIWGSCPGLSHQEIGQSALVVNLDSKPTEAYTQLSEIPF